MEFIVYLLENGEILRTITCPLGEEGDQLADGEACIQGTGASWVTHRVEGGQIVELPEARVPPAAGAAWDPVLGDWYDPLTRAETADRARRDQRAELLDRIAALELGQARPLRELFLALAMGQAVPAAELQRVIDIDAQIAQARAALALL